MKPLKWRRRLREECKWAAVFTLPLHPEGSVNLQPLSSSWRHTHSTSISFRPLIAGRSALVCYCNLGPLAWQPQSSGRAARRWRHGARCTPLAGRGRGVCEATITWSGEKQREEKNGATGRFNAAKLQAGRHFLRDFSAISLSPHVPSWQSLDLF